MGSKAADDSTRPHLRFVFSHAVRSWNVGPDATFQDVAEALAGLAMERYGPPLTIDLSFPVFDLSAEVRRTPTPRLRKTSRSARRVSYRRRAAVPAPDQDGALDGGEAHAHPGAASGPAD